MILSKNVPSEQNGEVGINVEGGFLYCGGWNFSKSVSVGPTLIREMRVVYAYLIIYSILVDLSLRLVIQNNKSQ